MQVRLPGKYGDKVLFNEIYKGKTVLVTGHTGFKGSWLTFWLLKLGANVVGISKDIPTTPALFEVLSLEEKINHNIANLSDLGAIKKIITDTKPDFIFHLAAQAIVSESYQSPLETLNTNIIGSAHVLESVRELTNACTVVMITSDKCYENVEWCWGYREQDPLGGKDIYSASKAGAEVIIHSYVRSFFNQNKENIRICSARAGNVIGGGDWAKDRIVVDCFQEWSQKKAVEIRSPQATRPWQHVLEPLSGYLALAQRLHDSNELHGESFNFGPKLDQNTPVIELVKDLWAYWPHSLENDDFVNAGDAPFNEAGLLKLNCDKALMHLKWLPTLSYDECIKMVGTWYATYYSNPSQITDVTDKQLQLYMTKAEKENLNWAKK